MPSKLNSPFRGASVGSSTKGSSVSGVISNTNVSNAELLTWPFEVGLPTNLQQLRHAQSQPTPLPTPIRVNKLRAYLEGYPISSKDYLINGFSTGFSLDYVGPRMASKCINLLSALQKPDAVDDKLAKELKLGRIVGPFLTRPLPSLHISPLGLIPKKTPGEYRLIHHLSFLFGNSVNSHIPKIATSVHYASIDDAIRLIGRTGGGCALAKTDVKNAFRLIPVNPKD